MRLLRVRGDGRGRRGQRALTVTNLAERFNVPLEEAWEEFREHGCPVLMENVHVWRCCPEVRMIGGGRRA